MCTNCSVVALEAGASVFCDSEVISVLVGFRETEKSCVRKKNYLACSLYTSSGVVPNSVSGLY